MKREWIILLMFWLLVATSTSTSADTFTERRIAVGQKLFHTMLVANLNFKKHMTTDGLIFIDLLYALDATHANQLARDLMTEITEIHGIAVTVRTVSATQYLQPQQSSAIGVFITEKIPTDKLQLIINQSKINQHILFSPFEGDVEKGVMAGLSVESRVRPYVNTAAMQSNHVEMKPFFIKVSKLYAP